MLLNGVAFKISDCPTRSLQNTVGSDSKMWRQERDLVVKSMVSPSLEAISIE